MRRSLPENETEPNIVVLHDFVLDHYVTFRHSLDDVFSQFAQVASRGGGNIVIDQYLSRGGKASNLASALARLGAHSHLIARTSKFGHSLAKVYLESVGVDISSVRADGRLALTVSLEMKKKKRSTNIMLSDPGSNGDFGFSNIGKNELRLLNKADAVVLADWALNSKGTDLADGIFDYVGRSKPLYIDPGDVSRRAKDIKGLLDEVLGKGYGILSLNESEALYLAKYGLKRSPRGTTASPEILGVRAAKSISSEFGIRVDLHTQLFSATIKDDHFVAAPTYRVNVRRVTGAGDAWNAGNVYAAHIHLSDESRLEFANALAAYYISSSTAKHPTRQDVNRIISAWRGRRRSLPRLALS
jgi:ribokinase